MRLRALATDLVALEHCRKRALPGSLSRSLSVRHSGEKVHMASEGGERPSAAAAAALVGERGGRGAAAQAQRAEQDVRDQEEQRERRGVREARDSEHLCEIWQACGRTRCEAGGVVGGAGGERCALEAAHFGNAGRGEGGRRRGREWPVGAQRNEAVVEAHERQLCRNDL